MTVSQLRQVRTAAAAVVDIDLVWFWRGFWFLMVGAYMMGA